MNTTSDFFFHIISPLQDKDRNKKRRKYGEVENSFWHENSWVRMLKIHPWNFLLTHLSLFWFITHVSLILILVLYSLKYSTLSPLKQPLYPILNLLFSVESWTSDTHLILSHFPPTPTYKHSVYKLILHFIKLSMFNLTTM